MRLSSLGRFPLGAFAPMGNAGVAKLFPSADSSQGERKYPNKWGACSGRLGTAQSHFERRASTIGVDPPGRVPPAEQRTRVVGAVSRPTLIWTLNRVEGTKLPLGSRIPHRGVQWPPAPRTEMAPQEPGNWGSSGSAESPPRDFRDTLILSGVASDGRSPNIIIYGREMGDAPSSAYLF